MNVHANPQNGSVVRGSASFSSQGPRLTVQTSDRAFITWGSFNIGVGETTTFVQPSASSVVWNRINDPNPSQILGNLQANGLVVLQNPSGFYVGGEAAIRTGGLIMTTTPGFPSDFGGGGMWQFNGPPPTASIVNYGYIQTSKGTPLFLIARTIENHGTLSAPEADLGLYATKEVLISERPDGRGLSATVRLPEGSVNNQGKIVADAGTIAMNARVVNQGGMVQANSLREHNGVIELVASDSLNLAASSSISARGDSQGISPGGQVLVKSETKFSDAAGSTILVTGGAQGGNGGTVEISAPHIDAIQSKIDGGAANGFAHGQFLIDPYNITLSNSGLPAGSGTIGQNDPPTGLNTTLTLNPNSFANFSGVDITLQAINNITLNSQWFLPDEASSRMLTLQAGNNITFNNSSSISAGLNWGVTLVAGADFNTPISTTSGIGSVLLNGNSFIETQNGSIGIWAGRQVSVSQGAIRTLAGGNISVSALSGNVTAGTNPNGYTFNGFTYEVSEGLGGISTAAGGDVSIRAGGNVTSFLPVGTSRAHTDGGSGAFGPEPGVVSITAGGSVFGHYVAANSQRDGSVVASTITALGGNAGSLGNYLALSLATGGWEVNAPRGSISLQEVRNPSGVFNAISNFKHGTFDYAPDSFVTLNAANAVTLAGKSLPRLSINTIDAMPPIYPPTLTINAGAGGVTLGNDVILYPSPNGELHISTTQGGSFQSDGTSQSGSYALNMSDSGQNSWAVASKLADHADIPVQLNNPNPVIIDVSGDVKNLTLVMPKETQITVGGNMDNTGFSGQNLHADDVTFIRVAGRLWNRDDYTFAAADLTRPAPRFIGDVPDYLQVLEDAVQANGTSPLFGAGSLPIYDPATKQLIYIGRMSQDVENLLLQTSFQVPVRDAFGNPLSVNGVPALQTVAFTVNPEAVKTLFTGSQDIPLHGAIGYHVGGPGTFDIQAASASLGATPGIISEGPALNRALTKIPGGNKGADISIDVDGDLGMLSSAINSRYGGDINIYAGGAVNVGLQALPGTGNAVRGIISTGPSTADKRGDISVIAKGDIDVAGSRIAAYNGGNILVRSETGNVNAGSGGSTPVVLQIVRVNPVTGDVTFQRQPIAGSGILAYTLPDSPKTMAVGNITVETPQGNISASEGGIVQDPLNGNHSLIPLVTLNAGTRDDKGNVIYEGNIDASGSGVIGVNTTLRASGSIQGLVIAQGNSDVNAAVNVSGTFLAGGTASFNAGGNITGIVIAGGGINSGSGNFNATAFSQNVSVGGVQTQGALASSAGASSTSTSAAGNSNEETKKTVANTDDDDDKKKRANDKPLLTRRVGRVTVILPKS